MNLIAHFDAKATANTTRMQVFVYEDHLATFPFKVYAGSTRTLAPYKDGFVQLADALKYAATIVANQLQA